MDKNPGEAIKCKYHREGIISNKTTRKMQKERKLLEKRGELIDKMRFNLDVYKMSITFSLDHIASEKKKIGLRP